MAAVELVIGPWNSSSRSLAAWLALQAAAMDFRTLRLDTGDPEVARRISDWSPSGELPVLRHDGVPVAWELWPIFELAAERDRRLWPQEPTLRARARSLVAEVLGFVEFETFLPMDFTGRFGPPAVLLRAAARQAERLRTIWREAMAEQRSGPFLFGSFGLVDAAMVPLAARFRTYALPLEPPERDYVEALLSLDAVLWWQEQAQAERGHLAEGAGKAEVSPSMAATEMVARTGLGTAEGTARPNEMFLRKDPVGPLPPVVAEAPRQVAAVLPAEQRSPVPVPPARTPAATAEKPAASGEAVAPPVEPGPAAALPSGIAGEEGGTPPPRRPLFGGGGLFRRATAPARTPQAPPSAPEATPVAPSLAPSDTSREATGSREGSAPPLPTPGPRSPERLSPVKPIGVAFRRRS